MLSINTNLSSLIAQNSLKDSTNILNQAVERMTTGYKINHAKDNAANYSIATNMTTKIGAYQVAEDNVSMGLDLLFTAETSLNNITDKISRVRALAIQSSNGTYGEKSQSALNSEAEALIKEVEREYLNCEYNGIKLFESKESNLSNVDQEKRVVNQSSFVAGETYYVADSRDLVKLQDLVNSGVDTKNVNFELTNDINMSGVNFRGIGNSDTNQFKGKFDGCGYVISNLKISTTENFVGLFGNTKGAKVMNLGLESCDISGGTSTGGLIGWLWSTDVENCYTTGKVSGVNEVGGLLGHARAYNTILNCYSQATVSGTSICGGLVGENNTTPLTNCFSNGIVSGSQRVGGFAGRFTATNATNCFSISTVSGSNYVGSFCGTANYSSNISNCYGDSSAHADVINTADCSTDTLFSATKNEILASTNLENLNFTESNGWKLVNGNLKLAWEKDNIASLAGQHEIMLHVASGSGSSASIGFDISFDLSAVGQVLSQGLDNSDVITTVDSMLEMLSRKSTEYGAIQNRLESVLEEISTQYENLVSSRSTLRDADMAEVSSDYIRQQILQQASATLLATANQSPSIALQLI